MFPVFHSFRLRAFLSHLSVSAVLGLLTLALVFLVWHPAPLYKAVGVADILLLLLGIDMILGPCLTLVVAWPGKKKHLLLLDIAIIITVQLSALFYGLYTVAEGRPAWLVLSNNRFNAVRVIDIDLKSAERALPEYQRPPWGSPQWISTPLPEDVKTRNAILDSSLEGLEIYQQPEYYRPLPEGRAMIQEKAQALEALEKFNTAAKIQEKLAPYPEADAWMPLRSEAVDMVVLLRKEEGQVLSIVDLRPW
jgi:hypothetical protein